MGEWPQIKLVLASAAASIFSAIINWISDMAAGPPDVIFIILRPTTSLASIPSQMKGINDNTQIMRSMPV
jgi:hypothetical protein